MICRLSTQINTYPLRGTTNLESQLSRYPLDVTNNSLYFGAEVAFRGDASGWIGVMQVATLVVSSIPLIQISTRSLCIQRNSTYLSLQCLHQSEHPVGVSVPLTVQRLPIHDAMYKTLSNQFIKRTRMVLSSRPPSVWWRIHLLPL